jgi:hypothetical protein
MNFEVLKDSIDIDPDEDIRSNLPEEIFQDGNDLCDILIELTSEGLSCQARDGNGNCYGTTFTKDELIDLIKKME